MARYHYNDSTAIDYQRFATKPQQQAPALEVLPENKNVKKQARAKIPYGKYAVIFGCVFAVLAGIIASYMTVAELTVQNDRLKSQIAMLESDENALNAKKEQIYNLPYVEEYARDVLGMVKLDKSQVEYVELSNPEVMTVRQEEEYSSAFLSGLAKSFNVILEYLN